MRFSKYEASGNDFILIDATRGDIDMPPGKAVSLCDRHRGVGADGVLLLTASDIADAGMRIINADGSEAEMCGNGIRALSLFARNLGFTTADEISVETAAGLKKVRSLGGDSGEAAFRVDMGSPSLERGEIPMKGESRERAVAVPLGLTDGSTMKVTCLSMGNPHCVVFVDDVRSYPVTAVGPLIENDPVFPERTNVGFARVASADRIELRVWERGVGETMACGTGACAAAVAASLAGTAGRRVTVSLVGGDLEIDWDDTGPVFMTGPARHVFDGDTVG